VNVTFHCAASVGIAHLTSRLLADPDQAPRPQTGVVIASSFLLGVLSHGVLDGLLHQYPIPFMIDPPLAVAVISLWCLLVQPRFRLLFTLTFVGAVLPDVIDLGSGIGQQRADRGTARACRYVNDWRDRHPVSGPRAAQRRLAAAGPRNPADPDLLGRPRRDLGGDRLQPLFRQLLRQHDAALAL